MDGIGIKNLIKIFRDFFNSGDDIDATNPLQVFDPKTYARVNALLVSTETGGTVTTDGTEQDVYVNNAPQGVFEPSVVKIDFTAQTAAETVVLRYYERLKLGGDWIRQDMVPIVGVQADPDIFVELVPNRFGVWVTMQRTAGGAFDYDWEALYRA